MRTNVVISCFLLLFLWLPGLAQERREQGQLVIEGVPPIPETLAERLRQYSSVRSASLLDWDPVTGGVLIATRFGETTQLHLVQNPLGARTQLTFFKEPVSSAQARPDEQRRGFLFSKDVGGGEAYQLFYFDQEDGSYQMLTDGKSRYGGALWSHRGDRFAFFGTERNGTDWDIYLGSTEGNRELVYQAEGTWFPSDWSQDDSRLLLARYVSANESSLHLLELSTGKLEQLNPSEQKIAYGGARFAPEGETVYFTSNQEGEFQTLQRLSLRTGERKVLTSELAWDVSDWDLSEDGRKLAFVVNEGGIGRLYLLDTQTGRYEPVEGTPVGQISGLRFEPGGQRLAFSASTATSPGDVYVIEPGGQLQPWTHSEVGGLNTDTFITPTLVEFLSFDGLKIPAFYFQPRGPGPHPVVVYIHGGPESQYTPCFSPTLQYLAAELGVAVVAPNVRGSSGYGKSYLLLDNGLKREDSVGDIGALLDWIATRPELDGGRVAVYGGSYGGYMVLASMFHYPDRLAAGIDVVGISNFVTFLTNTKDYRRDLRRVEYGDERDPEMKDFLVAISPTTNAARIRAPLFVVQGQNDPRVPVTESEQMVAKIRNKGGQVWYLMARDEGHGFRKKVNRDYYQQAVILFLERHLLPDR